MVDALGEPVNAFTIDVSMPVDDIVQEMISTMSP
jgi:hypothetical protein